MSDERRDGAGAHDPTGPDDPCHDAAERMRGMLFTDLDRLAFALEMEVAHAVSMGDEEAAVRLEDQRLGVRLAQRLVTGVYADEVDRRVEGSREAYDRRTGRAHAPAQR